MSKIKQFSVSSLDLRTSPFANKQGQVLTALNVERNVDGAWQKRSGYVTFLGTPDNSQITTLFFWRGNSGTGMAAYRKSGSVLYYSSQGTGAWTIPANGTFTSNSHMGHAVLDNKLIVGDGTASTKYWSATGTFTAVSGAPLAEHFLDYQGRIYATRGTAVEGVNTDMFYSTVGTLTDWTTDSSSIRIPGEGRQNGIYKANNQIVATKDTGIMYSYDGYTMYDLDNNLGPSSPYSLGALAGNKYYLNRVGVWEHGGGLPQLKSSPVERQIFNNLGSGITGTVFDNAPGEVHEYCYYVGVGTITDDWIKETIPDAVLRYDIQRDEWVNWRFANRPYSFLSFVDANRDKQFIFGDNGGQCYRLAGTATSDNGSPIESKLMGVIHGDTFEIKEWKRLTGMFNPGCKAKVQYAISDTFTPDTLKWTDTGITKDGVAEMGLSNARGRFLFWKIYDYSATQGFQFFGWEYDFDTLDHA